MVSMSLSNAKINKKNENGNKDEDIFTIND